MKRYKIVLTALILFLYVPLSGNAAAQDGISIHGFIEGAYGGRVQTNSLIDKRDHTLNETRLQLKLSHYGGAGEFFSAIDFLNDNIDGGMRTEIKEAYFQMAFGEKVDMKVGRQILTWGTGDLLFINDLFPKDYISFFTGREDQYLKLPSDAIKVGLFTSRFNVDLIGIPYFLSDRLPTGRRLSYFNPLAGSTIGESNLPAPVSPDEKLNNAEFAARAYRYFGNFQGAGYFFRGFYKDPMGVNPDIGAMYYPELQTYGASLRGPFKAGVLSFEFGYYDSKEDGKGLNPLIPNSQHKYLVGFERQGWTDFTIGLQYYGEYMTDYENYLKTLPQGAPEMSELRQVFTTRLTQMLHYQSINLSLFAFYSTSDKDWHIRPNISYKYSDEISISAGGNLFGGEKIYTMFGQFENNNNLYARFRYYF